MTDFFYQHKRIGTLKEGVFPKQVKKSKHLFRSLDAWGIQLDALSELQKQGCTEIRIWEEEENKIYSTPFEKMWKESTVMRFEGDQAFLPRSEWKVEERVVTT